MTFLSDITPTESIGSSNTGFLSNPDKDNLDDDQEQDYDDEDQGSTYLTTNEAQKKLENKRNAIWEDAMRPVLFPTPSEERQDDTLQLQSKESQESTPPVVGDATTPQESTTLKPSSTIEFYSDSDDGNTDQGSIYIAIKEQFKTMNEVLKNEMRFVLSTQAAEDFDECTKDEMSTLSPSHNMLQKELSMATDTLLMEPLNDFENYYNGCNSQESNISVKRDGKQEITSIPSEDDEDEMTEEMSALSHVQEMLRQELATVYGALNIELLSEYDEDGDDYTDRGSTYLAIKQEFNNANSTLKNAMQTVLLSKTSEEYEDELPEELDALSFAQDLLRQELAMVDEEIITASLVNGGQGPVESDGGHRGVSLVHFEMDDTCCEVVQSPVEAALGEDPQSERHYYFGPRGSAAYTSVSRDMEQSSLGLATSTVRPVRASMPPISKILTIATTGAPIPHQSESTRSSSWDEARQPTPFSEATTRRELASWKLGHPSFKSPTNESFPSYTFTTSFPTPSSVATDYSTDFWGNLVGAMDNWFVKGEEPEPHVEDESVSSSSHGTVSHHLSTISEGNETKGKLNDGEVKSARAEINEFIEILHDLRIETNNVGCTGDHKVADTVLRDESFNTKTTLYYDAVQSFASDPTVDILPPDSLSSQSENDGKPPRSPSKSPSKCNKLPKTGASLSKTNTADVRERIKEATGGKFKKQGQLHQGINSQPIALETERELVGNIILPESSSKNASSIPELILHVAEPFTIIQSTDLTSNGEQGVSDQVIPCSTAMQLPNRCSPAICAGPLSPRSQCSFRSEKTTMSEASAQRAHETLHFELQMIESMDLRSEADFAATLAASPRSQSTPEQIIKRLETQLDVYQELEQIKVKLLAVKARASPKAIDIELDGSKSRRTLDLQTSNSEHGEIEVSNGSPQCDAASISPLHSFRSHSMDDLPSKTTGEYMPAVAIEWTEDSWRRDRTTEKETKVELSICETDSVKRWGAQTKISSCDSSQDRNTLDLIMQEETIVTHSDSSTELIDLGTFGVEHESQSQAHKHDLTIEETQNIAEETAEDHCDDDESITHTLARIYLRSQMGTKAYHTKEIQEMSTRVSQAVDEDCSVSQTIERIAQRVAKGGSKTHAADGRSDDRVPHSNFVHPSENLTSNTGSRLYSAEAKKEIKKIFNSVLDCMDACGISKTSQPQVIATDARPPSLTPTGSYSSESLESEYPVSTRTTSLIGGVDNSFIQGNIDIFVTCISHKPPTLPLREELAGIGVELILHDPIDDERHDRNFGEDDDPAIQVDEIEPSVEETIEMQQRVEHARKMRDRKLFLRPNSPSKVRSLLPQSNSLRHQFYAPTEPSQSPCTPPLSTANSSGHPSCASDKFHEPMQAPAIPEEPDTCPLCPEPRSWQPEPVVQPKTQGVQGESPGVVDLLNCNERLLQSMVDFDYSVYCALTSPDLTGVQVGIPGCQTFRKGGCSQHEQHFRNQTGHVHVRMVSPLVRFLSSSVAVVSYTRIDQMVGDRIARQWDETRIWERLPAVRRLAPGESGDDDSETAALASWTNCHFHQSIHSS